MPGDVFVKKAPGGNERNLWTERPRRFQPDGERMKQAPVALFHRGHLMYRIAHMLDVVGHINEMLVGFYPLEPPTGKIKKQQTGCHKQQQPQPQREARYGAVVVEVVVPERNGKRPEEGEPHNGRKHHQNQRNIGRYSLHTKF